MVNLNPSMHPSLLISQSFKVGWLVDWFVFSRGDLLCDMQMVPVSEEVNTLKANVTLLNVLYQLISRLYSN